MTESGKSNPLKDDPYFYETLLEKMGQAASLVLNKKGENIYVSKRAERILGKTSNKIKGKNFLEIFHLYDDICRAPAPCSRNLAIETHF